MSTAAPVANPLSMFSGMSGGRTGAARNPGDGSNPDDPNIQQKKQGAGNTGFNRFLALHRGSRGGRRLSGKDSKTGAVYTSGRYKGMTEGQGDVVADRQFQGMTEGQRDRFRQMNEADYAKQREREIQAQKDQFALAREFQRTIRADIAAENAANQPKDNPNAGAFDPNAPGGGRPPVANPAAVASGADAAGAALRGGGGYINNMPAAAYNSASLGEKALADAEASGVGKEEAVKMMKEEQQAEKTKSSLLNETSKVGAPQNGNVRALQKRRRLGTPVKQEYA